MTGGAASGRTGSRYERELVDYLRDDGWGALRLPSSGSSTARDLPDVLAGRPRLIETGEHVLDSGIVERELETAAELWAIEAKSGKDPTLYVDAAEVDALGSFAGVWGATPYLAARSTRQATGTRHYLVAPEDARRTMDGNYGLPIAELDERASVAVGPEGVAWL